MLRDGSLTPYVARRCSSGWDEERTRPAICACVGPRPIPAPSPLIYHRGISNSMEIIMQPGLETTLSIEEALKDLDEANLAIERAEKRIAAQELRIAQLKRDRIDSDSAERILASMRGSLKELIMHRALIVHAIAYRE